ncbi:MAG: hypothetical protein HYX86_02780 [Chloroflexi bacterium]|nr:hypothetical protein [Chloroflexota bacterium]
MRRFLTLFVLLVFIILTPLAVYAFNVSRTLLDPGFYKVTLEKANFYQAIIPLIAEAAGGVASEKIGEEFGEEAPSLPQEEIAEVLGDLIDPVWLEQQIEGNVDAFFVWLGSNEDLPVISIDLRPIKAKLPEAFPRLISLLFTMEWEGLPLCAEGETIPLGEEPTCRPAGMGFEEFTAPFWEKLPACTGEESPLQSGLPPACRPGGVALEEFLAPWWESLAVCTEEESVPGPGDIPTCQPEDMTLQDFIAYAETPFAERIAEQFLRPAWELHPVCTGDEPPPQPGEIPPCRPEGVPPEEWLAPWWESLPACPVGAPPLESGQIQIPTCRPSDMTLEDFLAPFEDPFALLPNEVTIESIIQGENVTEREAEENLEDGIQTLREFRNGVRTAQLAGWGFLGLSGLTLLALAGLAATSLRSVLGWVGSGLLIAGVIALIPALLLSNAGTIIEGALPEMLADSELPPQVAEYMLSFGQEALGAILSPIQIQGMIITSLGLASIVAATVMRVRGKVV